MLEGVEGVKNDENPNIEIILMIHGYLLLHDNQMVICGYEIPMKINCTSLHTKINLCMRCLCLWENPMVI